MCTASPSGHRFSSDIGQYGETWSICELCELILCWCVCLSVCLSIGCSKLLETNKPAIRPLVEKPASLMQKVAMTSWPWHHWLQGAAWQGLCSIHGQQASLWVGPGVLDGNIALLFLMRSHSQALRVEQLERWLLYVNSWMKAFM